MPERLGKPVGCGGSQVGGCASHSMVRREAREAGAVSSGGRALRGCRQLFQQQRVRCGGPAVGPGGAVNPHLTTTQWSDARVHCMCVVLLRG